MGKEESTRSMRNVVRDVATAMAAGSRAVGDRAGLFKPMVGAGRIGAFELVSCPGVRARSPRHDGRRRHRAHRRQAAC